MTKRHVAFVSLTVAALAVFARAGTKAMVTEPLQFGPKVKRHIIAISTQDRAVIFSKVESALTNNTDVPLKWPSYIPSGADKERPLYVNLLSASRGSYDIELGWDRDCIGGNNCHYGTVSGSVQRIPEGDRASIPVRLRRGIEGHFVDFTCDAHCDDATVYWDQDRYHYSVSIKAGKKEMLIKIANSAIAPGR